MIHKEVKNSRKVPIQTEFQAKARLRGQAFVENLNRNATLNHKRGLTKMPEVSVNQWIKIGMGDIDAFVLHVVDDQNVIAGYMQNGSKAIKTEFVWDGDKWEFMYEGPEGGYLTGPDEFVVRKGPK